MLRSCALEWTGNWDEYLCLVEFAYNNSWHASIKGAPFELLYGRKCRAPICWNEVGERVIEGPELVEVTNKKVAIAKEKLKEAQSRQKSYADRHRRAFEFKPGDRVFLKVSPCYNYHLYHVVQYPFDKIREDLSFAEEPEAILDRQERIMRKKTIPLVKVLWKNHPEREATWENEEIMRTDYPHFFSRFGVANTLGKKVPNKVLRYFPIIPRLQHLYKSSHTAKEMTWHATGKCTEPGKMQHPVDGRAWKNFDTKYPNFIKEPRNVRLGLVADDFNPFGNLKSSFMLTLLIPGLKSPGKDIDVYLRPLIDDLKDLWAKPGVETIDVATGQKFNMRVMVLWTINDFPARSSLSGWSGRSLEFNGETEDGDPPREFDRDQIQAQLARLPTCMKGKHPIYRDVKIKRNVLVELNWTKRSIFYEFEYWSFLTLKHNLDIMHIEKNVLESILNTLLMNDKSKDTAKARQDLKRLGIRSGLWLGQNKNRKCSKPQAAYSFTPENRKKFCQFIKGVKLPDGFGSNFKHKVTDNDTNITGLKSHDCHIMMQRLLPYGLQQYLPDTVAKPIIELCSFFKQICSATLMEDDMLKAQSKVVDILCNLELIYPPAFFDIMIHLVIHLPLEALEGGPIRPRWMYPFERFMKKLKNYVRNKAKPEGSIAEGYVAEEALTFSSYYFRDVTTKFNRPDRNVDPPPPTCQF
ncbi:zinc finger, PHD-type containing protein [Tanacetum coccineum]